MAKKYKDNTDMPEGGVNGMQADPEAEERELERINELKMLKASWDMYEKTKKETEEKRSTSVDKYGNKVYSDASTKKTMRLLETMQEDIKEKYIALGGSVEELTSKKGKGRKRKDSASERRELFMRILEKEKANAMKDIPEGNPDDGLIQMPIIEGNGNDGTDDGKKAPETVLQTETAVVKDGLSDGPIVDEMKVSVDVTKARGNNIKYDMIPLPSKGQCYRSKISKVPVAYLTAYDENMIVSPNMYKDGSFLDYVVKEKLMTDAIAADDLLPGDRDAIILWLRASGYGPEFPVNAVDNTTGQQFESVVDLTKLQYKKFSLKGDSNGYFDYELPVSHDKVKFKFLSIGDNKRLEDMEKDEVVSLRKSKANDVADMVDEFLEKDDNIDREMKLRLSDAAKTIREYSDSIEGEDGLVYSHTVTNKLTMSIMSINGVTDRKYIDEYVMYMNVRDSSALRRYIVENEPGVDFNIEVERPKSLGGGSVRMFLTIDQFIFLTLA